MVPACLPNAGLNITEHQHSWISYLSPSGDAGESAGTRLSSDASQADSHQARLLSGSGSLSLTGVPVSIVDGAECNRSSQYRGRIAQDMLCVRGTHAAACQVGRSSARVKHLNVAPPSTASHAGGARLRL